MNAFIKKRGARPSSRVEAKAATRARILEAARAQLEARGFEETNIRGVAQAAGVATGTVLLHFSDKRDLLHTAVFEDLEDTWSKAKQKATGDRSLRQELAAVVKAFFDYYARRPALSRTLLRESLFAEPPWNQRFAAQVADVFRHVVGLAEAARARGEIDREIDLEVFGASFFSFYYFALLAWLQGGHPDPQRLFERMLDQHLPPPERPKRKGSTR